MIHIGQSVLTGHTQVREQPPGKKGTRTLGPIMPLSHTWLQVSTWEQSTGCNRGEQIWLHIGSIPLALIFRALLFVLSHAGSALLSSQTVKECYLYPEIYVIAMAKFCPPRLDLQKRNAFHSYRDKIFRTKNNICLVEGLQGHHDQILHG